MYLLYWLLLITVIVGGESSWTESDAHHTLVLGPGDHVVARNTVSMLTVHGGTTSSRALSNLIVKSSDFMHCSPYWVLLFRFREQFPTLKLKHALWFAAAIGNIISWHGRWAHPYPGISPTFWQCRDVLTLEQKSSKHWSSLNPGKLRRHKHLISVNPHERFAYLRMERNRLSYPPATLKLQLTCITQSCDA